MCIRRPIGLTMDMNLCDRCCSALWADSIGCDFKPSQLPDSSKMREGDISMNSWSLVSYCLNGSPKINPPKEEPLKDKWCQLFSLAMLAFLQPGPSDLNYWPQPLELNQIHRQSGWLGLHPGKLQCWEGRETKPAEIYPDNIWAPGKRKCHHHLPLFGMTWE